MVLAPHGTPGGDGLDAILAAHPDVGLVGPDDFAEVDGDATNFPLNTFAPAWTDAPGCADAFEAIARQHADRRRIAWRPAYGLEFPHVRTIIAEHLPAARIIAWLPDPVAATAARLEGAGATAAASQARMEEISRFENRGKWERYLRKPDALSLVLQSGHYEPALTRYRQSFGERVHEVDPDDPTALAGFLDIDAAPFVDAMGRWQAPAPSIEPHLRTALESWLLP